MVLFADSHQSSRFQTGGRVGTQMHGRSSHQVARSGGPDIGRAGRGGETTIGRSAMLKICHVCLSPVLFQFEESTSSGLAQVVP